MADLEPIQGLIELKDNFTSEIGIAEAALSQFSATNQESLKAVAGAAGLVSAALVAVGVATIELGKRGAEINEVGDTLEHFAGGASNAAAIMDQLRAGTKGVVDDFTLAKDAAHLLSAGVKLTTDDFGVLGQAASVLRSRGLGGTKEQLELVSDALVTGRTRALSMALGVVDATNAEEVYAKKLGISKDELSAVGVATAKREEIMRILAAAVKDGATTERNFAEEIEFAKTKVVNLVDSLGSAIAKSPVFAAGFKAIEDAVRDAFGNDQSQAINKIVSVLESGAKTVLEFGQDAITVARIFEGAWNAVRTVVLGVETAILATLDNIFFAGEKIATLEEKIHILPPGMAASLHDTRIQLDAMTESVSKETAAAAAGILGHTEFDKTLDELSAGLSKAQNAMANSTGATEKHSDALAIAAKNAKMLSDLENQLSINHEKVAAAVQKSSLELSALWDTYFHTVDEGSKSSADLQIADIRRAEQATLDAIDPLDKLYMQKYDVITRTADKAVDNLNSDWNSVKDTSISALQAQATKALETYNQMIESGQGFTREALDAQIDKYHKLNDAAHGWSEDATKGAKTVADAMKTVGDESIKAGDAILDKMGQVTKAVLLASGKIVALSDILKGFVTGTFDINGNPVNTITQDRYSGSDFADAATSIGHGVTAASLKSAIEAGYGSLQQLVDDAKAAYVQAAILTATGQKTPRLAIDKWIAEGGTVPGFAEGGTVMVGENGPEVVRLPLGSTVYPTGTTPGQYGGGASVMFHNTYHVNGTAQETARAINDILMRQLKSIRQFGAA